MNPTYPLLIRELNILETLVAPKSKPFVACLMAGRVNKSHVGVIINKLERDGLVRKFGDCKVQEYAITEKGMTALRENFVHMAEHIAGYIAQRMWVR